MSTKAYTIVMMNGSTVTVLFGEATAEQQIECYTLASSAWGSYLDEDEVIAREKHLSTEALARDGRCRTWCLYRQDDHGHILSTCKTVRRDFLMKDAGNTRQVEGYCISSVYTSSLYQGHGLASYMLQNVTQWLDGPGEAFVSMLYSGIPQFYENLGWTTLPNTEIILSISPWHQDVQGTHADVEVRLLSDADIEELCALDMDLLRECRNRSAAIAEEKRLTVSPTANLVKYQHALSDYMGDLWHGEAPETRGAAYAEQAWLYWYHDFRGRCLCIQRLHETIQNEEKRPDIIAALFMCAVREAKEWNFTTIATWDTSPYVRNALEELSQASIFSKSVSESHRMQRISLRLREHGTNPSNIEMDNEAYAWNLRY